MNLANIMKGLSIFAMRPLSEEEISEYNAYDECLDKASNTTVQDVAGGGVVGEGNECLPTVF